LPLSEIADNLYLSEGKALSDKLPNENMKSYTFQSILENGHIIQGRFAIGTELQTQWGGRKVVRVETVEIHVIRHDCPPHC